MSKKSTPSKKKLDDRCKVPDCGVKAKREGFCSTHFLALSKGLLLQDGKPSGKALAKDKKQREREFAKRWAEDVTFLKEHLQSNKNLLKVIQTDYPETIKPVWCDKLGFWACEAACFNRMFVMEVPPDENCSKCHQHDARFDWLKNYIGVKNAQKAA